MPRRPSCGRIGPWIGAPEARSPDSGLTEPWAEATLAELGWWRGDGPAEGAEPIMWALARSPDPDLALRALERLYEAVPDRADLDAALRVDVGLRGRLIALLGSSTTLADHLVTHPDRWRRLADGAHPAPDPRAALLTAVGADPDGPPAGAAGGTAATVTGAEAIAALRTAYRDEMLVLAATDLAAVGEPELPVLDVEDVAAKLADLAAAALQAALAVAVAEAGSEPGRLAVIAMGKCGGRELNYVSDVDVVFVAEPADHGDHPAREPGDAGRGRGLLRGRREPAARGQAGRAGAHARRARVLLQAVGQDLGVPGAAQGPSGGRRPGAGRGVRGGRRTAGVERRRAARTSWPTCRPCAAASRSTSGPTTRTAS